MKLSYYPDTDSLYIDLSARPSAESREVSEGVVLDYDEDGNLVGIDIDNASKKLDLSEVVTLCVKTCLRVFGRLQSFPVSHGNAGASARSAQSAVR